MAKDLDKKTIYMVLSRPISRSQYIVGKFLGMVMLIIVTMIFLSMCAMLSILLIKMAYPEFFPRFSWPMIMLALSFSLDYDNAFSIGSTLFYINSFITLVLIIFILFHNRGCKHW
jgi:ABC-type transport system involved in multi-copper enzyme maturation permease subunit